MVIMHANSQFSRYTQDTQGNTMRQQEYNWFNDNSSLQGSAERYPPTLSLNSTFPEALSRSLLQIAENQSRTIDAMRLVRKLKLRHTRR